MSSEVCKRKVDTRDEPIIRILDAAAGIKKREGRLQQHSISRQVLECIVDEGGIFEYLL
jgi:hypothetical protein